MSNIGTTVQAEGRYIQFVSVQATPVLVPTAKLSRDLQTAVNSSQGSNFTRDTSIETHTEKVW
jgi:hypothetical protein